MKTQRGQQRFQGHQKVSTRGHTCLWAWWRGLCHQADCSGRRSRCAPSRDGQLDQARCYLVSWWYSCKKSCFHLPETLSDGRWANIWSSGWFGLSQLRTYCDYRTTSIAVESKGHHVGPLFHLTFACGVIEVQDGVVDASLRQETVGHSEGGRTLLTNCWLTWKPVRGGEQTTTALRLEHGEVSELPQLPQESVCSIWRF